MENPIVRAIVIGVLTTVLLAGCSSKKLEAKVRKLEQEMTEQQTVHDEAIAQRDKTIAEKVAAFDEAEGKAREKISTLTDERDRLSQQLRQLEDRLARIESDEKARKASASAASVEGRDLSKESKFADAVVTITGDLTKGSGVVVEDGGKRFIYLDARTLAGNTRLSVASNTGTRFSRFGSLQIADGCPVARIELLDESATAIPLAAADLAVSPQTGFFCLSSGGDRSVSGAKLTVFSQNDANLECDVTVIAGKPGAAIVDTTTGRLIAVAAYPATVEASLWGSAAASGPAQPTACRVNRQINWQPVPIKSFLEEGKKLAEFNQVTRVLSAFGAMTPSGEGLGMSGSVGDAATVKSVLTAASGLPVAADALALDGQLSQKKVRLGEADLKKRLKGLFGGAANASKTSAAGFNPSAFSIFHRKAAEQALTWRTEADQRVKTAASGVDTLDLKAAERKPAPKLNNNW